MPLGSLEIDGAGLTDAITEAREQLGQAPSRIKGSFSEQIDLWPTLAKAIPENELTDISRTCGLVLGKYESSCRLPPRAKAEVLSAPAKSRG